ncbi:PHD finger protein [Trichuris trichiura]|uniref:PHD finger protein n=1 Tax=Trichuris trichiura TaxID=36087 RepID=A0A077Z1W7_TRITR|nr:PHD finger protein [Trichuris trichiura]
MLRVGELNGRLESSSIIPAFLDGQRVVDSRKLVASNFCCGSNASTEDACASDGTSESRVADYSALETPDSDGSDDKGYCSSPILDPVSFDHCYVSCQRMPWTSDKGKGHVAPRIKTLGSFEQAAEVATKLKQKNGDDRSAVGSDNLSPSCENEGEISESVQAGETQNPAVDDKSASELHLNDGDGHDYFTSPVYSQEDSLAKGVMPTNFEYVKPIGSGSTINLSGGFQQLREAQASNSLTSGSGPLDKKGSFVYSSALAYGCPKLQGAVSPVRENEKTISNGFTKGSAYLQTSSALGRTPSVVSPPSTAPVLEQARVVPRHGRSNFDVDDSNQSVYERIRIALEKAEAQKQLMAAKTNVPSPSFDKAADEEKSASDKPVSADKKQRKDKGPGKEKAPRKFKKKDSLRSAEEDYVTRCLCGFGHNDDFMIQCDRCEVWQHCECLAIKPTNVPEKYLCEICEPRCLPFTSEEASHLQSVKLNASKHGVKTLQEKKKRCQSSQVSLPDKEGHKRRVRTEGNDESHQQCSAELWKLVKELYDSDELDSMTQKLRPSPPCKVLYVAPNITGLVVACTLAPDVPILECFGHAALAKECRTRVKGGIPRPHVFLVNNFKVGDTSSVKLCLRFMGEDDQWMQHVRRSCHPNSKKGLRFFLVSTTKIEKGEEVCVPFDYDFRKSSVQITCACTSIHETARDHDCPVELFNKELMASKARKKQSSKILDKHRPGKRKRNRAMPAIDWNSRRTASAKVDSGDSSRSDNEPKPRRVRKKHFELIQLQQSSYFEKSGEASEGSVGHPSSADYSKSSSREERKMQFIIERIQRMEDTVQKTRRKRSKKVSLDKDSTDHSLMPTDSSDREGGKSSAYVDGGHFVKAEAPPESALLMDVCSEGRVRRKRQSGESIENDSKEQSCQEQTIVPNEGEEDDRNEKVTSASPAIFSTDKDSQDSSSNVASSRNAIGVISLLASAAYLNNCDREAAAALNAPSDNVVAEKSKKVRKMSIEEYKRLKRCTFEPGKSEQLADSAAGDCRLDRSELPTLQVRPSFFPSCTDESLKSVGSIPSLKLFSLEEHAANGNEDTPLFSKEKGPNAEPEPGDELNINVNRGALADRLDVMRPLFGVQCKEEEAQNPPHEAQRAPQQNNFTAYGPGSYYPTPFGNGIGGQFGCFPAYNPSYAAATPCMLPFGFYSRVPPPPPPPPPPATLPPASIVGTTVPPVQHMHPAVVPAVVPPGYIGNLDYLVMFSGTAAAATTAVALAAADQAAGQKQAPTIGSVHRPPRRFGSENDEGASTSSL